MLAWAAWSTLESERQLFESVGLTSADRTNLRNFIVQREGATPAAVAAVAGSGQAEGLMEGSRARIHTRPIILLTHLCSAHQHALG